MAGWNGEKMVVVAIDLEFKGHLHANRRLEKAHGRDAAREVRRTMMAFGLGRGFDLGRDSVDWLPRGGRGNLRACTSPARRRRTAPEAPALNARRVALALTRDHGPGFGESRSGAGTLHCHPRVRPTP